MRKMIITALLSVGLVASGSSVTAEAAAAPQRPAAAGQVTGHHWHTSRVMVSGAVADPASYGAADLQRLPQTTVPVAHSSRTVTGVALDDLVGLSSPQYGTGHNALLAGQITVRGALGQRVTFAAGELDPSFGNHRALLVPGPGALGINLVVPGDVAPLRSAFAVTSISVSVSDTTGQSPADPGSVSVASGYRVVTLSSRVLARLPQRTATVTYESGSGTQTHTERGPVLSAVLLAAGVLPTPNTVVTAVADDDYAASVTVGEAMVGGRPLLVSLAEDGHSLDQPRLVANGDVKGGRYVSGVVRLNVQR